MLYDSNKSIKAMKAVKVTNEVYINIWNVTDRTGTDSHA